MPLYSQNQKIPNAKNSSNASFSINTQGVKGGTGSVGIKTSQGQLGIPRVVSSDIPKMVKAPTRTGDAMGHNTPDNRKMKKVMKKIGG